MNYKNYEETENNTSINNIMNDINSYENDLKEYETSNNNFNDYETTNKFNYTLNR